MRMLTDINFVASSTAREYDFRLRHLKMRGVRGFFTFTIEDDYSATFADHHWSQPNSVKARFDSVSHYLFMK